MKKIVLINIAFLSFFYLQCEKDVSSLESKSIVELVYRFKGNIEYFDGKIPFPVEINDGINGHFNYNPNVQYYMNQPQTCAYYRQDSTHGFVEFLLNDVIFMANVDSNSQYEIEVCDDDPYTGGSDVFRWSACFPELQRIFNHDHVTVSFIMTDPTGNSFSNKNLPIYLNSSGFQYKQLFINGDSASVLSWFIRATINTVELESIMYNDL